MVYHSVIQKINPSLKYSTIGGWLYDHLFSGWNITWSLTIDRFIKTMIKWGTEGQVPGLALLRAGTGRPGRKHPWANNKYLRRRDESLLFLNFGIFKNPWSPHSVSNKLTPFSAVAMGDTQSPSQLPQLHLQPPLRLTVIDRQDLPTVHLHKVGQRELGMFNPITGRLSKCESLKYRHWDLDAVWSIRV